MLTSQREKGATNIYLILGVLSGLKQLMPYMKNMLHENRQEIQGSFGIIKKMKEVKVNTEKLIQVYEICLYFLSCAHDSVTSASLDTLNSLLINCTPDTKNLLLSTNGIHNSKSLFLPRCLCFGDTILEPTTDKSLPPVNSTTSEEFTCAKDIFQLKDIRKISKNVSIFKFKLPNMLITRLCTTTHKSIISNKITVKTVIIK